MTIYVWQVQIYEVLFQNPLYAAVSSICHCSKFSGRIKWWQEEVKLHINHEFLFMCTESCALMWQFNPPIILLSCMIKLFSKAPCTWRCFSGIDLGFSWVTLTLDLNYRQCTSCFCNGHGRVGSWSEEQWWCAPCQKHLLLLMGMLCSTHRCFNYQEVV